MTKYCLFDSGDVVGPFTVKQLLLRTGFGDNSLVCPEEHTAEDKYWKEARQYPEFGFESAAADTALPPVLVVPPAAQTDQFSDELDDAVQELNSFDMLGSSSLAGEGETASPQPVAATAAVAEKVPADMTQADTAAAAAVVDLPSEEFLEQAAKEIEQAPAQTPSPVAPAVEKTAEPLAEKLPAISQVAQPAPAAEEVSKQTVSTASPIEEYFNTMRGGDLGNILGMPDPRLNSDANLARTLEKQTAQNVLPSEQPAPEPELIAADKQRAVTEVPDEKAITQSAAQQLISDPQEAKTAGVTPEDETAAVSEKQSLELTDIAPAGLGTPLGYTEEKTSELPPSQETVEQAEQEPALPVTKETDPSLEPVTQDAPTAEDAPVPTQADQDAQTVRNILAGTLRLQTAQPQVNEPIKQVEMPEAQPTEELTAQRPLEQRVVQHQQITRKQRKNPYLWPAVITTVLVVILGGACVWHYTHPADTQEAEVDELLPVAQTVLSAPEPVVAAAPVVKKTPEEIAKEIVQQYKLDANRGTISQYLAQRYRTKLAEGYVGQWSAEPLHRDAYIVKYRLTKTRQEPIVYIFQVDTAKKQLTGALNNITLDLVGKLN